MSVREIQAFLAESYGTEVSPDFISSVTDEVMAETLAWQNRPLEPMNSLSSTNAGSVTTGTTSPSPIFTGWAEATAS